MHFKYWYFFRTLYHRKPNPKIKETGRPAT